MVELLTYVIDNIPPFCIIKDMNYELAKRLKENGFPQNFDISENIGHTMYSDIHFPSLSELIEACGKDFDQLERYNKYEEDADWKAYGYSHDKEGLGSTPEEAVANLWLELNK